mmetsp:Transcript_13914/g.30234  ORF Transcript_13914/g.30234 Transcript_13914/m.30234 type:complete len:124 (+) Transcript_13914:202-573(+)
MSDSRHANNAEKKDSNESEAVGSKIKAVDAESDKGNGKSQLAAASPSTDRKEDPSATTSTDNAPTAAGSTDNALYDDPTKFWAAWSVRREHYCLEGNGDDGSSGSSSNGKKGCQCFEGLGSVM